MQPPSLRLTDDELDAVFSACRPLQPAARDAFLQELADELRRYPEVGPGIVYRTIVTLQRKYFDPPAFTNDIHAGDLIERRVRLERVERGMLREAERRVLK
jgi:hypothetical protein